MCNNFYNLYPTNLAMLQQLGVIILTEHEFIYPCETLDNTYMLVPFIFL